MIKMKDIGNFQSVPQIVSDIINGNIPALNEHLSQGWDIEKKSILVNTSVNHLLIML